MKKLVTKFQEKLEISRASAITRVTFFLFFRLCSLATIVIAIFIFPYSNQGPTTWTTLYPGHYEIVLEVKAQEIKMDEGQFSTILTDDDTIFVSVDSDGVATFLVNKEGISFFYKKEVASNSLSYEIEKIEVENGTLIIEKKRSTALLVSRNIILPLVLLLLFWLIRFKIRLKSLGYAYDKEGKFRERFKSVY